MQENAKEWKINHEWGKNREINPSRVAGFGWRWGHEWWIDFPIFNPTSDWLPFLRIFPALWLVIQFLQLSNFQPQKSAKSTFHSKKFQMPLIFTFMNSLNPQKLLKFA